MATVLVVEDDPIYRTFVCTCLEHLGHRAQESPNGAAALAWVAELQPQLIITDIYMPVSDGLDLIRELRTRHGDVKVIAMSFGYALECGDSLDTALSLGAHAALYKPFRIDQLQRAIAGALADRGGQSARI